MTNTTEAPTVATVLSAHGYANVDDARAAMVTFGCFGCRSIAAVTPLPEHRNEAGRIVQRDAVLFTLGGDWDCCPDADTFEL